MRSIRLLAILVALIGIGCENREEIVAYDAPKEPPPATAPLATVAMADAVNPHTAAAGALTWTVPQGWQEKPGGEMRFATFQVNDNPPVELTVIPLGTSDIAANVNRWENQLGLPPTPAEKMDSVLKKSSPNGLEVTTVDLKGEKQRMLAALVPLGGRTWYFKMLGPNEVVEKQKQKFDAFIASLKPGDAGAVPQPQAANSMKLAGYKAAEDWKKIPGSKGPRIVAFSIGADEPKAELVVTRFNKDAAGGMLDNVNRWRGQIGLPPVDNMQNVTMSDSAAGSEPAVLLQFDNPGSGGTGAKRMLVAISVIGPDAWFFKLTGPPQTLDQQKAAFEGFLKSLQFAPEGDAK